MEIVNVFENIFMKTFSYICARMSPYLFPIYFVRRVPVYNCLYSVVVRGKLFVYIVLLFDMFCK